MVDKRAVESRVWGLFLELLAVNAPSREEDPMVAFVEAFFEALSVPVTIDDAAAKVGGTAGNVLARLPGTVDGPTLLLCAHLDTVEPTPNLTTRYEDDRLTSDGTTILGADDRAGVAAILETVRRVCEERIPHPPLEMLFTVAEEVGLMGSQVFDYSVLNARFGFVPDSTGLVGRIVTRGPAQQQLDVAVHGTAAHAGMDPERGVNAIAAASRAIARMRQGRIDEETTANIGVIQGGKATNIVPDLVRVTGEARSRDPLKLVTQTEHMRDCFHEEAAAMGGRAEVEIRDVYPAFHLTDASLAVQLAAQALRDCGVEPTCVATGGGSDANFINKHGIDTVILSAGYEHPHCHDESIAPEQLVLLADVMTRIVGLAGERAEMTSRDFT